MTQKRMLRNNSLSFTTSVHKSECSEIVVAMLVGNGQPQAAESLLKLIPDSCPGFSCWIGLPDCFPLPTVAGLSHRLLDLP